ncbi:MAG: redoxin domain-containing protein, partial [Xanthomonadales bacterium]|nr:redoxin domain-containing protein [Xanthomonadales bacterium]
MGDKVPDWEITTADGTVHSSEDYAGQLLVLDFWSSWCPNCNDALPVMQLLHE